MEDLAYAVEFEAPDPQPLLHCDPPFRLLDPSVGQLLQKQAPFLPCGHRY